MNASSDRNAGSTPSREQIDHVVALLSVVYRANRRMAEELDRFASSRASVSEACVAGFLRLAEDLRPGAAARAQLAALDQELQVAGAAEWIARRRSVDPGVEVLPACRLAAGDHDRRGLRRTPRALSARDRARLRWHGNVRPR